MTHYSDAANTELNKSSLLAAAVVVLRLLAYYEDCLVLSPVDF